jgi:hypothetical protein
MNGSELTPSFTFMVGVIGGLVLGFCLCYLWLARIGTDEYEEEYEEYEEYEELIDDNEVSPEKGVQPIVSLALPHESQPAPILDSSDTPPSTPASTSNSGSLPERQPSVKRQESALTDETIDSDFRPPAIRFDGNEYVVEGLKSTKTTKFLTFEEWGQSLNRIHRDVLDSHENDTGLAGESWLNMGAENPALTKEEDAPPPALASSIRIPIELKKRGPS